MCVAHGGLTACPVCGLLAGLGRWEPVGAAVRAEMPTCSLLPAPPQAPGSLCHCHGGFCASAWAGAGVLSCCSTVLLPGEGSTALAKGELILGPCRDLCNPTSLGSLPGQPAVSLHPLHSSALPYPQPLDHFWGDPGILPLPRCCDMGQSTLPMPLVTAASVPSPTPCPTAKSLAGLDKTLPNPYLVCGSR